MTPDLKTAAREVLTTIQCGYFLGNFDRRVRALSDALAAEEAKPKVEREELNCRVHYGDDGRFFDSGKGWKFYAEREFPPEPPSLEKLVDRLLVELEGKTNDGDWYGTAAEIRKLRGKE